MKTLGRISCAAAFLIGAADAALAAPVTLACQSVPESSHVQIEPDILIVDEAVGTVDFTEGAYHLAPPLQMNANPTRHVGTYPASFSQNEITFAVDNTQYHLNRVSGTFSAYMANGTHYDRDMVCHPQQRQF